MKSKDVVAGLGEIGLPILKILSKSTVVNGYDVDPKINKKYNKPKLENLETVILHICIPFNNKFSQNILKLNKKFNPKIIVIHSTVKPYTTKSLQSKLEIPVIYSATRGIHRRMVSDIKKYTKFFAIEKTVSENNWAANEFSKKMKKSGIKTKRMSDPITLELAKIVCDTSYYGWLINYAQLSNMIAIKNKVNYDEMWSFSDEIHKYVGNRPKLFPGFIGGHCVIPNLDLIDEQQFWQIDKINNFYAKKVPNAKSINKKYDKFKKQSYDV